MVGAITLAYTLAGLGLAGRSRLGTPSGNLFDRGASLASLVLMILLWHSWLVVGLVIDIALLAGALTGLLTRWFSA